VRRRGSSGWRDLRRRGRAVVPETRALLGRHDLFLLGAGVTFYAAVAVPPLAFLTVRLLRLLVGPELVDELVGHLTDVLPNANDADVVAEAAVAVGSRLSWWAAAACVVAATLYGEGLRRAYSRLAEVDDAAPGLRGRLAVLPLLVVAPLLLLAVLGTTPVLNRLAGDGLGPELFGVWLALTVNWLVLAVPLGWSFHVVAPASLPWRPAWIGGLVTAAFVSGFLQGFVVFLRLPIDFGAPFAGASVVGATIAVLGWLWILHLVVLVGFAATLTWAASPAADQPHGDADASPGAVTRDAAPAFERG
jgi:membrane protein